MRAARVAVAEVLEGPLEMRGPKSKESSAGGKDAVED